MDTTQPKFGTKLKQLRTLCGFTQEKTAELAGCSSRWYQSLEKGEGTPSQKLAQKLLEVLTSKESEAQAT